MICNIPNKNVKLFSSKCLSFIHHCAEQLFSHCYPDDFSCPKYQVETAEIEVCSLYTELLSGSVGDGVWFAEHLLGFPFRIAENFPEPPKFYSVDSWKKSVKSWWRRGNLGSSGGTLEAKPRRCFGPLVQSVTNAILGEYSSGGFRWPVKESGLRSCVRFTLEMYWTAVESAPDRVKPFRGWNRKNNFMCCLSLQFVVEILTVSWCGNDARLHSFTLWSLGLQWALRG